MRSTIGHEHCSDQQDPTESRFLTCQSLIGAQFARLAVLKATANLVFSIRVPLIS
jgi:hypothetical protein